MLTPGLYLVSCPIGNQMDITLRALSVLKEVDVIAAEDTRVAGRLLTDYDIKAGGRLISCHEHNENQRSRELLERLQTGQTVALITDAGTPAVSDPGFRLVQAAIDNQIRVLPVPGVSAAVTALSASGLPSDAFVFAGFLPRKSGKRQQRLEELAGHKETIVLYESPRRIRQTLEEVLRCWGDRRAVVGREMTKTYEEFLRGRLSELLPLLAERDRVRGEITLVVAGADEAPPSFSSRDIETAVRESSDSTARLAKKLAASYGISRQWVYDEIIRLRQSEPDDPG